MTRILLGSAKLCFEELHVLTSHFGQAAEVTIDVKDLSGKVRSHDVFLNWSWNLSFCLDMTTAKLFVTLNRNAVTFGFNSHVAGVVSCVTQSQDKVAEVRTSPGGGGEGESVHITGPPPPDYVAYDFVLCLCYQI